MKFKSGDIVIWTPPSKNPKPILCKVTGASIRHGVETFTVQPNGSVRTELVRDAVQLKLAPKPKATRAKTRIVTPDDAARHVMEGGGVILPG